MDSVPPLLFFPLLFSHFPFPEKERGAAASNLKGWRSNQVNRRTEGKLPRDEKKVFSWLRAMLKKKGKHDMGKKLKGMHAFSQKKLWFLLLRTLYSFIHHFWDPFWCREIIKIKESLIKLVCCPMCHFGALSRGGARERESKTLFVFPIYFSPTSLSPPLPPRNNSLLLLLLSSATLSISWWKFCGEGGSLGRGGKKSCSILFNPPSIL